MRPALTDAGVATTGMEADTLGAVLKCHFGKFSFAAVRERLPVGLEVISLKASTANLPGEQAVLDGMVDVLQNVTVDSLVDRGRSPFRVDKQYAHPARWRRCVREARNR